MKRKKSYGEIPFEESIGDDWSRDLNIAEVPIGNRPFFYLGCAIACAITVIVGWTVFLNISGASYYAARADDNAFASKETPAPRGIIYDREGDALVENKAVFSAILDPRAFLSNSSAEAASLDAIHEILGLSADQVFSLISESGAQDFSTPIVLMENLNQTQLVNLQAHPLPGISIQSNFERHYLGGSAFSSVLGYVGRPTQSDLKNNTKLTSDDFVGKTGIEAVYDSTLQGTPGVDVTLRNARGVIIDNQSKSAPAIGGSVHLTIDGPLQNYFYSRLKSGLASLGRDIGLGIAVNPQTGEVLSMVNLPGFDNNVFSAPAKNNAEIHSLLTSPLRPLFNRAVGGFYNPGSTIKPLVATAALKEGVIDPSREIFSPGYIMVPNPFNVSAPTKYLDWRYQGNVDLASALAQSSDVYFYVVGGGSPRETSPLLNDPSDYGITGLGVSKLHDWWQKFGLGQLTGIDMPGEAQGFLPTPEWKQKKFGTPWLLGDTYNVSIGQGDLLVTPLQLISYISAIANGGKIYRPFLNANSTPAVNEELSSLLPQIEEVQKGMRETVAAPKGTAYPLHDLPFSVCAKTGSAQVQNNAQENALFVGYAPCDHPQIALLILIENSKEGSLNAVPIAKDVLNWYYENELKKQDSSK